MGFQQGLSGLGASSRALDVISSNVANSGTVGFKASSAVFADTFASAMGGGVSNLQVGMGGNTLAVRQSFTQGATTATNNPLDLAIGGNGFFQIERTNGSIAYSRNGQFDLDKNGYIVNPLGERLQGYQTINGTEVSYENSTTPRSILIPPQGIGAKATGEGGAAVVIRGNLDSDSEVIDSITSPAKDFVADTDFVNATSHATDTYNFSTSATVYDSLGETHTLSMYFVKLDATPADPTVPPAFPALNNWEVYIEFDGNGLDGSATPPNQPAAAAPYIVRFDTSGNFYDIDGQNLPPEIKVSGSVLNDKAADLSFKLDLSNFTQNTSSSSVLEITQDGSPPGELASVSVNSEGIVQGRYTNGETKDLGRVILATFRNPNGLVSLGDNLWAETIDSGQPAVAGAGVGLNGTIGSGRVEESNVDMSAELVNMIIQQRNYQANAQSIKTQDQILQTLINLR